MARLLASLLVFSSLLGAQTPKLDKPPQDVDDALRARITKFYDLHVAGKYRQAEQLVAEESKDDFYVLSKPDLKKFQIGNIEYSDNFTKAKVVIVGSMPVLLPMAAGKIMDMPFASYWKLEDGTWCWYYNKVVSLETPFGRANPQAGKSSGKEPTSLPTAPDPQNLMAELQSALSIDRTRIEIKHGKPETVKVTSSLPGAATLSVISPFGPMAPGIVAKFDKSELKGKDTAMLTLSVDEHTKPGSYPLAIMVSPTNQILNFNVNIVP